MDNVKRILVPIDSSEIAERAMQQAIKINRLNEAEVHILYVADINKLAINAYLSDNVLIEIEKSGQCILNAAKELLEKYSDVIEEAKVQNAKYRDAMDSECTIDFIMIDEKDMRNLLEFI